MGNLGQQETNLPHVHAEAEEYYGGNQVWSRARTFSNVSRGLSIADARWECLAQTKDGPFRWVVRRSSGTGGCRMVSGPLSMS